MTPESVLRGLVAHGPPIIAQWTCGVPDQFGRCVFVSRVGYDVLQWHGIATEPVAMVFTVANRVYVSWRERGARVVESRRAAARQLSANIT
jgi:hypothetical protein